jgi:thiamine biosynthesis lipoprotein
MKRIAVAWLLIFAGIVSLRADEAKMLEFVGRTMGTTYSVKIFDPPLSEQKTAAQIQLDVDALLRRVNDQMSTYLKSSEISRFNASDSTDWFEVSSETAAVVDFAQQVSAKTEGAFDVTVAPLVNAWSFGSDPRTQTVPDQKVLDELKLSVGYQKLLVRIDPPALRKSIPSLKVDLSAIAKGHGVDRVVALLNQAGAANVFVEIGGEVRTSGDKAGQWWKVGIQLPDGALNESMIAYSMSTGEGNDHAMATSGDYRNFFEVDGVQYSHTIDPRTAKPIEHGTASVSVIAETCMEADAWATAINVLGPQDGIAIASREGLSVLLISRGENGFELAGTGTLEKYAVQTAAVSAAGNVPDTGGGNSPLAVLVITFVVFALVLFAMAVGVMFGRRAISGSCGGLSNTRNEDGSVSCSLCSNPADACKELRQRMQNEAAR